MDGARPTRRCVAADVGAGQSEFIESKLKSVGDASEGESVAKDTQDDAATESEAAGSTPATGDDDVLDLMDVAGGAVAKRIVPVVVAIVVAVIIYLIVR